MARLLPVRPRSDRGVLLRELVEHATHPVKGSVELA